MQFDLEKNISPTIFQAYDIRGVVDETLNPNIVYTIGMAIGSEARSQGLSEFVIGRDGRLSGYIYIQALRQGLLDSGCDVIDIGTVTSPVLYFATHTLSAKSGVILTASHNPANYNGMKIMIAGETLAEDKIKALLTRIQNADFTKGSGKFSTLDIVPNYFSYITNKIKLQRKLRIVIDCGNGIAGSIAPQLFRLLGCEVIELFCEVDGNFPNHHPDPSVPENLQQLIIAVRQYDADIGLAFDGDGDRLGVVDNLGKIIWPDRQLMLFAQDLLSRNAGATIIYDVKCSWHVANVIRQHHGIPLMWKTGHSLIKNKLKQCDALLAGEMSGHIFFKEGWFGFDDGLYTAVRMLKILAATEQPCSEIFANLPESIATPEIKLPIEQAHKFGFMDKFKQHARFIGGKIIDIDGLRVEYDFGWGLVRPSNTTPCLIFRFEADNESNLQQIQTIFKTELLAMNPELALPF